MSPIDHAMSMCHGLGRSYMQARRYTQEKQTDFSSPRSPSGYSAKAHLSPVLRIRAVSLPEKPIMVLRVTFFAVLPCLLQQLAQVEPGMSSGIHSSSKKTATLGTGRTTVRARLPVRPDPRTPTTHCTTSSSGSSP